MYKLIQQQPSRFAEQPVLKGWYGRTLLVSVAALMLLCAGPMSASGHETLRGRARELQDSGAVASPPPPLNADVTPPAVVGKLGNATTPSTPPPVPAPSPPKKDKASDKWDKSAAEKGIAITVGVLMLVSILTCLVCCVFRRGGQWRVPGMEWFKKKFGQKDKYSRYVENQDDGF